MQFLGPALGAIGMIGQYNQNQEAEHNAQAQLAQQQQMEAEQYAAYTNYMGQLGQLKQQGAFNPAARLELLNNQGKYNIQNAMSSEAGAARSLGYRPGDTTPIGEMNQTQGNFQLEQQQAANNIYNQSNANYIAGLEGAPSLSDLGSGINAAGENARMDYGMMGSNAGLLQSMGPYLQSLQNQGGNTGAVAMGSPGTNYGNNYSAGGGVYGVDSGNTIAAGNTGTNYGYDATMTQAPSILTGQGATMVPGGQLNPMQQAIVNNGSAPVARPGEAGYVPVVGMPTNQIMGSPTPAAQPGSPYGMFAPASPQTPQNGQPQASNGAISKPNPLQKDENDTTSSNGAFGGYTQRPRFNMPTAMAFA